jgi:thiamine phosphate synthase YjbQ (UPF0047 family)
VSEKWCLGRAVSCKRCAKYLIAHITASVFINDDERGLHADYEDWLECVSSKLRQALHEPISRYCHNHTEVHAMIGTRNATRRIPDRAQRR